ncbi:PREDICTED: aminopeptidase N-like [Trachymyrmex cornetzi]|uniref:aminopeptidase N-like n=1 Tax=Trachymyrmex cornetzi TaxID=471704 RepID=UPI00084EDBBF|nr:PREDICTED: aminopeptidase N-like [Trachymyrmex cornetzi]
MECSKQISRITLSGELLFGPHIQANGMRQLFPCWDEPHFKATFNISIIHPRYYSALSNMPTRKMTYESYSDSLRTNFHITPLMSTFQIAIVVTDYYDLKINENVTLWCDCYSVEQSPRLEFTRRIINDITLHLKSEFSGINIPKMDHVAIPNFPQDGTSKWGLIFHTEANLICDEQSDSFMHKIKVARLIAPKIAYQWFSNVFSYNWWTPFWLHDGLATLFGEETIAKIFNDSKIMDFLIVQNQYESLHLDSHFDMNPQIINLLEIDSLFSFPRYLKALTVLRMLQSAITDKVFRKNVRTYVNRYSTVSFDFWSMQPIKAFKCYIPSDKFLTWITYRHYQIVTMEQDETDSYIGRLSQMYNPIGQERWWIPMNLKNYNLPIAETFMESLTTCLTPDSPSVTLYVQHIDWTYDCIVNIQRAGYYRVKYNLKGWNAIANYLNSTAGEYEGISVINRAKIIDDAFHLMMEHQLDVSIFWNLTQFLSQETNYVVWYPMIKVFEYMSTIFPFPEDEIKFIDDIKAKFRELLDKPVMAILLRKHLMENGFTESFKQEILKWSCTLKHNQCARLAEDTLGDHLQNPEIEPVSSEWKHWTYCRGFILCHHADYSMWDKAKNIWFLKPDHDLLPFLACCESESILTEYLPDLFFSRFTQNQREDVAVIRSHINTFHSIVSKHANTYNILRKILLNLVKIKPKEINTLTALTDIINYVYSIPILSQANHNFPDELKNVGYYISENQLSSIQHKIQTRLSEINRHIEHFQFVNVP